MQVQSESGAGVVVGSKEWFCRAEEDWGAAELLLAHGAAIVAEKRACVFRKLGYTVSAGTLPPFPLLLLYTLNLSLIHI